VIVLDAGDWERRQGYELQAGMEALGTAGENCVEITRRWKWEIQIDSDCPRGLAQLEDKTALFFRGAV